MTCTVKLQKVIKLDVYRCSTLVYIDAQRDDTDLAGGQDCFHKNHCRTYTLYYWRFFVIIKISRRQNVRQIESCVGQN